MSNDDPRDFQEMLRALAKEVTDSIERLSEVDVDGLARKAGLDPDQARGWVDQASQWLQDMAHEAPGFGEASSAFSSSSDDPVAADTGRSPTDPHPLDTPTPAQGAALAALDSGRWTITPDTGVLTVVDDEGPGPGDPAGLVRDLRVRDWLRADGTISLTGSDALRRWLSLTAS